MAELQEQDSGTAREYSPWRDPLFWVFLLGVIILVVSVVYDFGSVEIKKAAVWGTGLITLAIMSKAAYKALQHYSPKLVLENYHTSITGDYLEKGIWRIFRSGGIHVRNLPVVEGRDGIVIVPETAVNRLGKSVSCTAAYEVVSYEQLPPDLQEVIEEYKLNPPYRWAVASEEQSLQRMEDVEGVVKLKNPDINILRIYIKHLDALLTDISGISKKRYASVEEFMAAMSRIQSKSQRTSLADQLRRAKIIKEKD